MPKALETIKRPVFKDDVLHKHIADTYFYQKTRPKARRRKNIISLQVNLTKISIVILLSAATLALITTAASFIHAKYLISLRTKFSSMKMVSVISRGSINKEMIKKFEFRGYARKGTSRIAKDAIILNNPKKYNWADLAIDFKFPVDCSGRNLALALRGTRGGEKINVALRDVNNRAIKLNEMSLPANIREKIIPLDKAKGDIDLSKIEHLRIEYGHAGESVKEMDSPINVTIYITGISLIKEK